MRKKRKRKEGIKCVGKGEERTKQSGLRVASHLYPFGILAKAQPGSATHDREAQREPQHRPLNRPLNRHF